MANTIIRLRKSSVSSATPNSLEFGEIAINYADGYLFYKDSLGNIKKISGGSNSFSTINVAGSLLTAAVKDSVLTIAQGENIVFTTDILNDAFTISANLHPAFSVANAAYEYANTLSGGLNFTDISDRANLSLEAAIAAFGAANQAGVIANSAYDNANSTLVLAQAAFDRANLSNDILVIDTVWTQANAAYDKANAANVLAYNTGIGANNYAGFMANAANAYAASLTPDLSPVFVVANTAFDTANAAYDKANNAATNSFTTIAVQGQDNVAASINDTLKLAGSNGINITSNASNKSISFSVMPGTYSGDYGFINTAITVTNDYGSL